MCFGQLCLSFVPTFPLKRPLCVNPLLALIVLQDISIPSDNKLRHFVHKLVYNKYTENFMIFVILANMVVMFCVSCRGCRS